MAGPSPSFNTVRVFGTWRSPATGAPVTGRVRFTFPTRVVSVTDDVIFPGGTVKDVTLDATGSISVEIPAVDDPDNLPATWKIQVQEIFDQGMGTGVSYEIMPLMSMVGTGAGTGLNLRTVIPLSSVTDPPSALVRGVKGGVAALNTSGNVVDAFGVEILSGGSGGGGGGAGTPGKSAYQVAVDNGFVGTTTQWLASLKGTADSSAYQAAVAAGFVGTEAQWLASLKGANGTSAYQAAVAAGFSGTEAQWLASLRGNPGTPGTSAYQSAVAGGFNGTEAQWLASLKGTDGQPGSTTIGGIAGLQAALDARLIAVQVTTSGSTEARPAGAGVVLWIGGTVKPVNMTVTDVWLSVAATSGDATPPSVPTGVSATGVTANSFTVSWTASTDDGGVTGYEVQVDGVVKASPTGLSATITGLNASTTYSVRVRARDAAGNWSALSTPYPVTTSAPSTAALSVFGANPHPGTLTKATDGPVKVATAFYTFSSGANGWRNVGARLYVPAGITVPSSCEMSVWEGGTSPDISATPSRTATLTGIAAGQWNEVRWPTPLPITPSTLFWVGYRFADGSYLAVPSTSTVAIKSGSTNNLYLAEENELPGPRSRYKYDNGAAGGTTAQWGVDVLVDTGA